LKGYCPNRSFKISSSDSLATGAAGFLFLDVEALFTGGAARCAASFFTDSRFTTIGFFGTPSPAVGVVGFGACVSTPANGDRSANSITLGAGMMVSKLLSMSTRSGNFSNELILMTGLSIPVRIGSATGGGTNQLSPTNNRTRALPTNPKYLSKGIDRLHLDTTGKPLFLEES
jgi:hypothetical protein